MSELALRLVSVNRLLVAVLVVAAVAVIGPSAAHAAPNPIVVENQQPGTGNWQINEETSDDVAKQIKGYASATSVNIGDSITFFVTVNPVQTYTMEIYRIGYYQGLGGRLMQRVPLAGVSQPGCPMNATTGMIFCEWSPSYVLTVPPTWTSGIYLVKLTNAQLFQNYILFTVRDDSRTADLLYQQSVNTYQAYNNYPDDAPAGSSTPVTGKSLYEGNSSSALTGLGTTRAVKVSFDRPYSSDDGAGDFLEWEIYFVRWIEQSGYDVSYSTDVDTHESGSRLLNYKGFLSVGHDEYWSENMYDAATAARDGGVGLGFFGANDVYWQVRMEPSMNGATDRVMVCYKDYNLDPVHDSTASVTWRDPHLNRPEQQLIGVQFTSQQPDGAQPARYVATNTSNWVYAGTGMKDGDSVPGIIGYETDHQFSGVAMPSYVPGTYTLIARSPYTNSRGVTDFQNSVVYESGSGAWVFGAGSIGWSWGLYNDSVQRRADARIQKITANVLNRFLLGPTPPPAAPTSLGARPTAADTVELNWTDNASNEDNFVLERSTTNTFDTVASITLPSNATSYTDSGLAAGVYYYRVRAVSTNGSSPNSNVAGAATTSYSALVNSRSGLKSYWRLGESSGSTAVDSKGSSNGSYLGGVTLGAPGAIANDANTAVTLNGSTGKISLPAQATVTDFSIEGWTNLGQGATGNPSGNNALYGTVNNVRLLARPGTTTAAYAGVWLGGTEYVLQPNSAQSNLGAWVHWVMTRSGGTLSLYRNGTQIAQRTDLPATATANISGWIGAQGGNNYFLNGNLDDVATYTSALSASQIADNYTAGSNGLVPQPPPNSAAYRDVVLGESSLLSYWRLGESSGSTAVDSKGTSNGTYQGGVTLGAPDAITNDANTAVTLNGSTGKVSLPTQASVTDYSIEGWTNLGPGASGNPSGNNALYGTLNNVRLLARPGTSTAAYAGVWLGGTEYVLQPNSVQSNLGVWVHWVMTRSGGTLTLYRDGVQVAQRSDLPATATANISGWIGAQGGSNYFLNGSVDDVAIYNSALTASQVSNHYVAALSGPAPAP